MTPFETFQSRKIHFQNLAEQFQKQYNQWAVFRAILFVAVAAIGYFCYEFYDFAYTLLVLIIGIALFLFSVTKHLKIKYLRDKNRTLSTLNEDEIHRLENRFTRTETGEAFAEDNHFYASDLDIFGKQSLYKLLNRTHTFGGAKMLANWLLHPAETTEILNRQKAIQELSEKIDWRQDLEAFAMLIEEVSEPTHQLLAWNDAPANQKIQQPLFQIARFLPYITIPMILAWIFGFVPIYIVLVLMGIHGLILKQIFTEVTVALDQTNRIAGAMKAYSALAELIVREDFQEEKLQNLKSKIAEASPAILALEDILNKMANRTNPFFAFVVGIPTLWDIQYFIKLENWKANHRENLPTWLAVIAEFETLNSLAGYRFANPTFIQPRIVAGGVYLQAKALGHPMIRHNKRVSNDIELIGGGKTIIITGSNMSGKSTFQRTVAINVVLALTGGVVCAESFECSYLQVFTSMRSNDSLEEGTSSFYAELKRLKQLIDEVGTGEQNKASILYFLDEILKGTNSKDRHEGARALMLQLHKTSASGFISTHDVELGDEFDEQDFVKNYSFSSEVVNDDLVFDYKLRKGVCHSFNASQLMKRIGIEM